LDISNELAATISNALYTPKKKPAAKVAPLKTVEEKYNNETAAPKAQKDAPVEAAAPVKKPRRSRAKKETSVEKDK
jgi:hypothetical protein